MTTELKPMPDEVWIDPESLKRHSFNYVEDYQRPGAVRYTRTPLSSGGDDPYKAMRDNLPSYYASTEEKARWFEGWYPGLQKALSRPEQPEGGE